MTNIFRKLILSNLAEERVNHNSLKNHANRIKKVWDNEAPNNYNSIGIERLVQLFLLSIQFIFIGTYIRYLFARGGVLRKNVGIEFFVLLKFLITFLILYFSLYNSWLFQNGKSFFYYLTLYMSLETLLYIPTLLFCENVFAPRRSVGRSAILTFFNYFELILTFSIIYASTGALKSGNDAIVSNPLDCLYFSVVTSCTIGYGDITPCTEFGKQCVIAQAIIFLVFGAVLLNILLTRGEKKTTNVIKEADC